MITTNGRLLTDVCVSYSGQEIRVSGLGLCPGEEIAIVIDTYDHKCWLYAPIDQCRRLAVLHHYELVIGHELESLMNRIQRFAFDVRPRSQGEER